MPKPVPVAVVKFTVSASFVSPVREMTMVPGLLELASPRRVSTDTFGNSATFANSADWCAADSVPSLASTLNAYRIPACPAAGVQASASPSAKTVVPATTADVVPLCVIVSVPASLTVSIVKEILSPSGHLSQDALPRAPRCN